MAKEHYVYQEGQTVFKFAVKNMADVSAEIMERNHLSSDDVTWLIPTRPTNVSLMQPATGWAFLPKR